MITFIGLVLILCSGFSFVYAGMSLEKQYGLGFISDLVLGFFSFFAGMYLMWSQLQV